MNSIHFDSVGGASGDMILGALIDLGADVAAIQETTSTLCGVPVTIETGTVEEHGLHGTRARVIAEDPAGAHPHRGLGTIRKMIEAGTLSEAVKSSSIAVFQRLAEAEAHVHQTTVDKVGFHEVGAIDAIVDIVGSCTALEQLDVERVTLSPLPLGQGTTTCSHGVIPIPVPATLELLKGFAVVQTDEPHELVTPTGAALLSTLSDGASIPSAIETVRIGHGFGQRTLDKRPNLLRARLYRKIAAQEDAGACHVMECNIDDTVPELLGSLIQQLLDAGAYDAYTTPIQMKKQRPGTQLSILAPPAAKDVLIDLVFRETTTFGIREYETHRTMLTRRHVTVSTPYGDVRVKLGKWQGELITRSPEHDDCVRCATESNTPVRQVYEAAVRAASEINE